MSVAHQSAKRAQHGPYCSHTEELFCDSRRSHSDLADSPGRHGRSVVAVLCDGGLTDARLHLRLWFTGLYNKIKMTVVQNYTYHCNRLTYARQATVVNSFCDHYTSLASHVQLNTLMHWVMSYYLHLGIWNQIYYIIVFFLNRMYMVVIRWSCFIQNDNQYTD